MKAVISKIKACWQIIEHAVKKNYVRLANFLIVTGIIILLVFLFKLSSNFSIIGNKILLDESSKVGDFVGGLVGSIWALASVLLFYSTLVTQREDFNSQQKEVVINRLSSVIFLQIDRIKNSINETEIMDYESVSNLKGREAFSYLYSFLNGNRSSFIKKQYLINNKAPTQTFLEDFNSSISLVDKILTKNKELTQEDKNELMYLFSENFGKKYIDIFKHISEISIEVIKSHPENPEQPELQPVNNTYSSFAKFSSIITEILKILEKYKEPN